MSSLPPRPQPDKHMPETELPSIHAPDGDIESSTRPLTIRKSRVVAFDGDEPFSDVGCVPKELSEHVDVKPRPVVLNGFVFWAELANHLLFPFSFFFVWLRFGKAKLENNGYKDKLFFMPNVLAPLHLLLMPVFMVYLPGVDRDVVDWVDMFIMFTVFFLHRAVVAAKYAYMHPEDYAMQLRKPVARSRREAEQIVHGWLPFTRNTQMREQHRTARRLDLDVEYSYVTLRLEDADDPLAAMLPADAGSSISGLGGVFDGASGGMPRRLLDSKQLEELLDADKARREGRDETGRAEEKEASHDATDVERPSGDSSGSPGSSDSSWAVKLPRPSRLRAAPTFAMRTGCFTLHLLSRLPSTRLVLVACTAAIVTLGHAFAPPLTRHLTGQSPFGDNMATRFVAGGLVMQQFCWTFVLIAFLLAGIVDYSRRYHCLNMLSIVMARNSGDDLAADAEYDTPVRMRLDCAANIHGWLAARRLLRHLGERFFKRIQLYTSFGLLIGLAIIGGVVWMMLSDYATLLRRLPQVASLSVDMLAIIMIIASMIHYGSKANALADVHREQLVRERLDVRERMQDAPSKEHARLNEVYRLLGDARDAIELEDRVRPITLLGFRASHALVKAALVALGSAAATAARVLT